MECSLLLSISDRRGAPGSAATHHPPPTGGLHCGPEAASWPGDPPPLYNNQYGHTNYDNENPVAFTPGGHRAPAYAATLTPIPQQASSYEIHSSNPPSRVPYTCSRRLSAKKRNTRSYQACDRCRQLRTKCDERKPCKSCADKGLECRYRDPAPKATDKAQAAIRNGIAALQASLPSLSVMIERMEGRLSRMEDAFSPPTTTTYQRPQLEHGPENEYHESVNEPVTELERILDAEPGPPVPPGTPAIPINHTTLASLLLDWPSIRELTKCHVENEGIKYIGEFPILQEQIREPLAVYRRGETGLQARHVEHGAIDMVDGISKPSSAAGADLGHFSGWLGPPTKIGHNSGVLGFDGHPDFCEVKIWEYVESFKENMLNMHPIIEPQMLYAWVRQFLDNLPTVQSKTQETQVAKPAFAIRSSTSSSMPNEVTGAKRKRYSPPEEADTISSSQNREMGGKTGRPQRTLVNAVVLTVLAAGKVCLYQDQVPDVVHSPDSQHYESPTSLNSIASAPSRAPPPNYSGPLQSTHQSPHDRAERGSQSRRSSNYSSERVRARFNLNYDVIPGLEYFAYASDILGNHMGSYNSLDNIYANVFASLYLGQLARPLESFAYIRQAGHKLEILIRPSLDKLRTYQKNRKLIQETPYNQLVLAFWTCLQLESDLIAELQLPPSCLLCYEEDMPPPNMSLVAGFSQRIFDSYLGQLYLRKHLNSIHRMFYSPDDPTKAGTDMFRNVNLVADSVSRMSWVAPSFAFQEDDPPADDILAARLRAKYWGAQTITYRPFIRQILQSSHSLKQHPGTEFRNSVNATVIPPNATSHDGTEPGLVELAKKGIKALIESTRSFHNLGEKRPIITNVFGTAHAQWGNLLVLSAAYRDPVLSAFVDEDLLEKLFDRTIAFLQQSAAATSSLRIDLGILEGLRRDLFYGSWRSN